MAETLAGISSPLKVFDLMSKYNEFRDAMLESPVTIWMAFKCTCSSILIPVASRPSHTSEDIPTTVIRMYVPYAIMNCFGNRKEGNDQESIQLPSKTPMGKKDALKATAPKSK